ncbi:MAG TPA: efflux RND transporter periplasmic adaptor subunit [Verrucomicrobiae bacterium]|nr:efflux RND transporter periplasmic adaptor subunit [Verrucomicrobiae bacterium]
MTEMTQERMEERTADISGAPVGPASRPRKPHAVRAALIVLLLLLAAGGFTVVRRLNESKVLAKETEKLAIPTVSVVKASAEPSSDELMLPAQLQAYVESPIYSRTNGYLLRWYKDIGSQVRKGELLADIDTPEVDQELSQARATRDQIRAQMDLAKSSAERWINLRKTDSVSQQEADQQISAYNQAKANLAASDASVRRLEQLESFKHIYAPFSGVLTQRNTDTGALINSGSTGQSKGLFNLAQVDPLRVYVSVPQANSPSVHAGMTAFIELDEYPGKKFPGKVMRTADAIDPATRTLLTEVDVPNKDAHLLPGAYAKVHFAVPVQTERISVPINTLLFRAEGPRVAVVGPDKRVHLKTIIIGRDFGTKVEILGGLDPSDQIVVNPADSLVDGQQVNIKAGGPQS